MDEGNGCDFWPDGLYKVCCDAHDIAYTNGGNILDKLVADWNLASCVLPYSNLLNTILMFIGVTVGGLLVYHWGNLKGKNLFEIIFRKKYDPTGKL